MLSKNDIIKLSGYSTYIKGETYFKQNRVTIVKTENGLIEAKVRGSNRFEPYDVSIEFSSDGRGLESSYCDCPAYYEYGGICKHIVALILKVQFISNVVQPTIRSDNTAMLLLQTYIQGIADKAIESHVGHTILEPILDYGAMQSLSLFFRVGDQRMYMVQDLVAFQRNFQNHATASYGKFSLYHNLASFCEESRPIVEFFLRRYDEKNYIYNPGSYNYYYGNANKKYMFLSPQMADEFFNLFDGKSITVRDEKSRMSTAAVVKGDYCIYLRLKKEAGGASLEHDGRFLYLSGDKNTYILDDSRIFCCGEGFTLACRDLLNLFNKSNGRMFFADSEIGVLFSTVLPRIMPYIELDTQGEFEQYKPLPLVTRIYLDSQDSGSVTARMTFTYGEKTINAFGEKNAMHSHDIAGEILAENLLAGYFKNMLSDDGTLRIEDDPGAVYLLVSEGLDELSRIAEIYTTDAFGRIKLRPPTVVTVGVRVSADLMQLDFDLEGIDLSELPGILDSYRAAKKYHRLRDGSFLMLEETALSGLSELAEGLDLSAKQLTAGHAELASSRALYLDAVCKRNEEMRVDRDRSFKQILRDMGEVENADFPVPAGLRRTLRNYQKTGFRWLKTITAYGFGGILADDMGLGKTLQILALLKSCYEEGGEQLPSIVVCPSSLSLNWESEAQKFTPELRTAVISGTAAERSEIISRADEFDLIITSYDLLKRDIELYESTQFRFVIIDEAQYIKNQTTQNAKSVKALNGKTRFALTGTPIENSLAELWSIFDFLMPGYLFTYNRFKKKYEEPIVKNNAAEASERLRQLVRPFLLRRLKSDVLRELPAKTETILRSSMEDEQKKLYIANLAQAKKEIGEQAGLGASRDRIMILAALTRMRQICCDPALIYENYDSGSVKLEACMELIESCIESGRRMLLFSQFTSMLDIIGQRLVEQGVEYFRIDGSVKPSSRLELVNTFNSGTAPIFLISLKAGGTGLNLTGADVVIHYDPWWNLSAQNQATDRAHRIGQKNSVQVYKLIVKDTVEERIFIMQEKKADLANLVIEENANPFEKLNREELLSLFDEPGL